MRHFAEWLLHHRRFDWVPADVINAETGSMDDYCTCWLCKRRS